LVAVTIPGSVVSIGYEAFSGCTGLTRVFFAGAAPSSVDSDVFLAAPGAEVYYCSETAGWSSTFSDSDHPTVPVTVPLITQPPTNQYAVLGKAAIFSVSAFGPQPITYQWQFNGSNVSGARSSALKLSSVQGRNGGSYSVVVANSYGSVTSPPALLSVETAAGTYKGLIMAANSFDNTNSGAFVLTVASGGAYSAKLTFPSETISTSGKFAFYDGQSNAAIAQFTNQIGGRRVEFLVMLALDSSTAVSGSLTALGDANALAQIDGARVSNTANFGLFDVAVLSATTNPPAGNGYGAVAVSITGASINLALPDQKTVITALASDRLNNGAIPVFTPLYSKKGFFSGWLTLTNQQVFSESPLAWHKDPDSSASSFAEGFNQWVRVSTP
jgi:hypothetical protein